MRALQDCRPQAAPLAHATLCCQQSFRGAGRVQSGAVWEFGALYYHRGLLLAADLLTPPPTFRSPGAEPRAKVLPEAREGRQPGSGAAAAAEEARRAPVPDAGNRQPPGARRARQPPGAPRRRLLRLGGRGQRVRRLAGVQWRSVAAHAGHYARGGAVPRGHRARADRAERPAQQPGQG